MVFTAEDRILIKNLYLLKGYNCTRLLAEFPEKNWKKGGLKKLLRKIRETGGCDRRDGSGRPKSARTDDCRPLSPRAAIPKVRYPQRQ